MSRPSIQCRRCSLVSYNLTDIEEGFCARCQAFTRDDAIDLIMSKRFAQALHNRCAGAGDLLIWTVLIGTTDYPSTVCARPHSTRRGALSCVLLGESLEDLRLRLPADLTMLARHDSDDPVIVETWL